jgi:aspartyl-tRNA(Asn)/glutamyl-tRNA(Gln) amidotransferase subunit B
VVTEPDFRTAEQVIAYLKALHALVTYLGISDGNMSEGSMRCDVNISLRPNGESAYGTRTELKNINSFRFIERAIRVESQRQQDLLEAGHTVTQETRLFDPERDETRAMRSKEVANDYRYFPDPDLLPIVIDDATIEDIKASLPELPVAKRRRYTEELGLSNYDANLLTQERATAEFFEVVAQTSENPKSAANWVLGDVSAALNKDGISVSDAALSAIDLAALIGRIDDNTLSSKMAKDVFDALWQGETNVDDIIDRKGLKQVSDSGALEAIVNALINDNAAQVEQYRVADEGKQKKLIGFFVGQAMKASKGQANPQLLNQLLKEKLG